MTGSVPAPTASKPFARRTRVKLRRVNSDYSKPYPPDGDNKLWWDRLKAALGTTSSDFVNATRQRTLPPPSGFSAPACRRPAPALLNAITFGPRLA